MTAASRAILAQLPRLRREAEALMTDTCTVSRSTGETVTNPDFTVTPVVETVYTGRSKCQTYEAHESLVTVGNASNVVQRSTVHFPAGAFQPRPGDVVTVTASADPLMVGRRFRVVQLYPVKTHATAYRVYVDENVGEAA